MLFGKYCLLERVSVGGMAEIFRAKPFNAPESQKHLALKRILPHLAEDDEFVQMFIDEATLTVQLLHPNIVRTYELGRFHTSPYILMEFISGQDLLELQRRLRDQQQIMGVEMACYVAREIAHGLDYVHSMTDEDGKSLDIIHRDISPQNILVTYSGNIKIIDFGIAKGTFQETHTQVGVLKGKFGYMSPEQVRGRDIDHRSDIYSVGTLMWELLTNRRLFRGENEYETLQMLRDPQIVAPSEINPEVPAAVDRIVARALATERDERYQNGGELAAELDAFLSSQAQVFGGDEMSAWMNQTFAVELDSERYKRQYFHRINTPEDVHRLAMEQYGEEGHAGQAAADPVDPSAGSQGVWASELVPDDGDDLEEFASEHTIVAAGGFDAAEFASETEEDMHLEGILGADDSAGAFLGAHAQPLAPADLQASDTPVKRPLQALSPLLQRRKVAAIAAVLMLLCLTVLTLMVWLSRGGDMDLEAAQMPNTPEAATLVLSVTPPEEVEVLVDGESHEGPSPLTLLGIEPGEHMIEVSHPEYQPFEQRVELVDGAFKNVRIKLKSAAGSKD